MMFRKHNDFRRYFDNAQHALANALKLCESHIVNNTIKNNKTMAPYSL